MAGALVYAALLEVTTPKVALLIQLVVPVILGVRYVLSMSSTVLCLVYVHMHSVCVCLHEFTCVFVYVCCVCV